MEQKVIYENDKFSLETSGRESDFIYLVFNKTNSPLKIIFSNEEDFWVIKQNDWLGLFNTELSNQQVEDLKSGNYTCIEEKNYEDFGINFERVLRAMRDMTKELSLNDYEFERIAGMFGLSKEQLKLIMDLGC